MKSLKYYYRAARYYTVIAACNAYYWTLSLTPWKQAKVLLAFKKYTESMWFRERFQIFGKEGTIEMFFEGDYWFFARQITREEKWGIFLNPYKYIAEGKKAMLFIELIN